MNRTYFLMLLVVSVMTSCDKEPQDLHQVEHFIRTYVEGPYRLEPINDCTGFWITILEKDRVKIQSPDTKQGSYPFRERYLQIAERNGDTEYNRFADYEWYEREALADNFCLLSVTSDKAWDTNHPAGTGLGDILLFKAYSYSPYIRSGYSGNIYTQISVPLNHVTEGQMEVLNFEPDSYLRDLPQIRFLRAPSTEGPHTLTLTITTPEGKTYRPTITLRPEAYVP